jgi:hypothetical protein
VALRGDGKLLSEITWSETVPSDGSRTQPRELQDIWNNIRIGLDESLDFPGTGGPKGGSFKFHRGNDSDASWNKRHCAYWASDVSRLFVWDTHGDQSLSASSITFLGGTPRYIEHIEDPGTGKYWVTISGTTHIADNSGFNYISWSTDGKSANKVVFDDSPTGGFSLDANFPIVMATSSESSILVYPSWVTAGGCNLYIKALGSGTPSDMTVYFQASGYTTEPI